MSLEEKTRVSGEVPRSESKGPVLPTVNPNVEKQQAQKPTLHPAIYVM